MAKVAFLGLGAMGSRMAANLVEAGHELSVWNRSPENARPLVEAGAKAATTPHAAVKGTDFAITMLRDSDASRDVWLRPDSGALSSLPDGAIGIECSTVSPDWIRQLAREFQKRGRAFLEAPVSGSRPQAEARQLIFLTGGDAHILAKAEPILQAMGNAVHHAGPVGNGIIVKLAVNALLGIQVAAMGELIGFLKHTGADEAKATDILTSTSVCSPAAKIAAASMIGHNFTPMFAAELMEKDLGYILAAADGAQARIPVSGAAREAFREALSVGHAHENMTSIVQLYE
jgi:3-hydroxyisobutyrate dehydrogenase